MALAVVYGKPRRAESSVASGLRTSELPSSSAFCDETGDAFCHYFIESQPGLNAIDFVKRVFRKGGDVEILSRASRGFGCCEQSRTTLDRHANNSCAGVFPTRVAIAEMTGSSSSPGFIP